MPRDRRRINVKGGGDLRVREISPTASNTFLDVGYLSSTVITDEGTMVESPDEAGNYIDTKRGARKVTVVGTLKQSSKEEIDLLRNADGKYYDVYYRVLLANTNVQEFRVAPAKLKVGFVLNMASATERTLELTISGLAPKGAHTATPTAFNLLANDPLVIVEGATAVGPPTETAASVATNTL